MENRPRNRNDPAAPIGARVQYERLYAYPVSDLSRFFEGAWRVRRRIQDRRLGVIGKLSGMSLFARVADGLRYSEEGTLQFGNYRGTASRSYELKLVTPAIAGVFHEGRFFYQLDLSSGLAEIAHDCPPDHYRGRYWVGRPGLWSLGWEVCGPRKRISIATWYYRASAASYPRARWLEAESSESLNRALKTKRLEQIALDWNWLRSQERVKMLAKTELERDLT